MYFINNKKKKSFLKNVISQIKILFTEVVILQILAKQTFSKDIFCKY